MIRQAVIFVGTVAVVLGMSGCGLIGAAYQLTANVLNAGGGGAAGWKLVSSCLPEGTLLDTPTGRARVEMLRAGDVVVGFGGEPVRVVQKHEYVEDAFGERFLKVRFEGGAVVDLCDLHRIGGVRSGELKVGDEVAGLKVESVARYGGVERSYDLLTEDEGYRVGGVPVNSMIDEMMADLGRMAGR